MTRTELIQLLRQVKNWHDSHEPDGLNACDAHGHVVISTKLEDAIADLMPKRKRRTT